MVDHPPISRALDLLAHSGRTLAEFRRPQTRRIYDELRGEGSSGTTVTVMIDGEPVTVTIGELKVMVTSLATNGCAVLPFRSRRK